LAISSWRGGWKVSILFILLAITPKTHLIILEGGGLLFLGRYLLPELRGTPHSSPHLSISIESGLEDEGRVSALFVLPPASPENWNSPYMWSISFPLHEAEGTDATEVFSVSRSLPAHIRIKNRGIWCGKFCVFVLFHLTISSTHNTSSPLFLTLAPIKGMCLLWLHLYLSF
jgi:hypothetical protein